MLKKYGFLVIAILVLVLSLASCNLTNNSGRPGDPTEEYQFNDTMHWNIHGEEPHTIIDGVCSVCGYRASSDNTGDKEQDSSDLEFEVYDTYAVLTGLGTNTDVDLVIPDTYMGKPVTEIADRAFPFKLRYPEFESIAIPDSVVKIGEEAFYSCEKLKTITMGSGVASIGSKAFWGLTNLTSIHVSEDNPYFQVISNVLFTKDGKTIVKYAGQKTDSEYIVPDGVQHIGDYAFHSCKNLTKVILPDGIKSIGVASFSWCDRLENLNLPEGLETIADSAFGYTSISRFIFPDTLLSIGEDIFHYIQPLTSIHIGAALQSFPHVFINHEIHNNITLTISEENENFTIVDGVVYNKSDMSVVFDPNPDTN